MTQNNDQTNNNGINQSNAGSAAATQYMNSIQGGGGSVNAATAFQNQPAMYGYQNANNQQWAAGQQMLGQAGQTPASQAWLMNNLQGTINGTGQSAADIQMQQGQQQGINAAQAAINSNSAGLSPGLAAHQAGLTASGMQQQNVNNTALLRAQEVANAQSQFGGAASAAQNYQLGLGQLGAGLQQNSQANNLAGQQTVSNQQIAGQSASQAYLNGLSNTLNANYQTNAGLEGVNQQNSSNLWGSIASGVGGLASAGLTAGLAPAAKAV